MSKYMCALNRPNFNTDSGLTRTGGRPAGAPPGIPEGIPPDQAFVQILDPATGTGTFLVEVIDLIHKTIAAKWKSQGHGEKEIQTLWNDYVPEAPPAAPARVRTPDGSLCHRSPQDQSQALRDRLPFRER